MYKHYDRYSKTILWLKYTLPLFATALFISIFVFKPQNTLQIEDVFNSKGIDELTVGQKITNPLFSGVLKNGDAFTLNAREARPDSHTPKRIELISPSLNIKQHNGNTLSSLSNFGEMQFNTQRAILSGDVVIKANEALKMESQKIIIDLNTTKIHSPKTITITSPYGNIKAGSMVITTSKSAKIHFAKGIRLIYLPLNNKSEKQ